MDFFARQAATRRQSRWMVFLFALAVIAIVVAIDFVVVATVAILSASEDGGLLASPDMSLARYPVVAIASTVVVLGTIGISSLVRTVKLAAGGGKVAEQLGGTRVGADTTDPLRRRLRNVVEEMAIASGVPVPQVYVLEREAGINAFAAGYSPANAAVAVTQGALDNLSRDELQGVIAHEFSHVLNGDMRLSTRLIGLLFGLTVISLIARTVLRLRLRGGGRKGGGGILVIYLAAVVVFLLGWIGLFFGRVIQAAVSRHRESLADASAVQFTRDPTGLRNALVKIGAHAEGSRFADADAEEVAHMVFAPALQRALATHPPLVERIREIDPRFQESEFGEMRRRLDAAEKARAEAAGEQAAPPPASERLRKVLQGAFALAPGEVAGLVANPGTDHVLQAHLVLASLPESYQAIARQPEKAKALFLALALDGEAESRERQLAFVRQQFGGALHDDIAALLAETDALEPVQRMPALLQVFGSLHQVPRAERVELLKCLNGLLVREGRAAVFPYALRKLAQVQLQDELNLQRRTAGALTLQAVRDDLQLLLSVLALHGGEDETAARQAFEAGMQAVLPGIHPPYERPGHWPPRLDQALARLDRLQPPAKEKLVGALVRTVSHDQRMTVAESELVRAICAALHCPLPPLYAAPKGDAPL
jgi:Zn-dependent protease with chaperone function